jgi:hypothetical protein
VRVLVVRENDRHGSESVVRSTRHTKSKSFGDKNDRREECGVCKRTNDLPIPPSFLSIDERKSLHHRAGDRISHNSHIHN